MWAVPSYLCPMQRRLQLGFQKPPKVVLGMLIGLFALWVLAALGARSAVGAAVVQNIVLDAGSVLQTWKLWTLATYPLIAPLDSPFSLLISLLMIYWFGGELAKRWGPPRFLFFLVAVSIAGGIFATVAANFGLAGPPLMGAFVISLALITAWGLTFPDREILLFFVLPVKGIHMVWLSIAIAVLEGISTKMNATVVAADFGAMAMAAALVMGLFKRNKMSLFVDKLLVTLRIRKKPNLYVVPKHNKGPDKFDIH